MSKASENAIALFWLVFLTALVVALWGFTRTDEYARLFGTGEPDAGVMK